MKDYKDIKGKVTILRRLKRVQAGNFGDVKSITEDIKELRFTTGSGYRIYFTIKDGKVLSKKLWVIYSHNKKMI